MAGRQPSVIASPDSLRAGAAAQSGDSNIVKDGLTFGVMRDGARVGKFAAVYRRVAGTAATVYALQHDLGFVPAWAQLVAYENSSAPVTLLVAGPIEYDRWTATEVRVKVSNIVGAITGATMWFMIGGER